mgnify:CR=1 FL=1
MPSRAFITGIAGATLTAEEFRERANRDEGGKDRATNTETFLRNEWGIRTFGYTSLVVDPPNGRIPEITAAGKARAGNRDRGTFGPGPFDAFQDFTLYDRCVTRGVLGSTLPVIYGNGLRIVQNPGSVAISYEMIHDTRIIPTDGRSHVSENIRQFFGDPVGHWEGDTLVVETTNFNDMPAVGRGASRNLKVVEKFTRTGPETVLYQFTVTDPSTWEKSWAGEYPLGKMDGAVYEYACQEANYGMANILSGARADERKAAGQK